MSDKRYVHVVDKFEGVDFSDAGVRPGRLGRFTDARLNARGELEHPFGTFDVLAYTTYPGVVGGTFDMYYWDRPVGGGELLLMYNSGGIKRLVPNLGTVDSDDLAYMRWELGDIDTSYIETVPDLTNPYSWAELEDHLFFCNGLTYPARINLHREVRLAQLPVPQNMEIYQVFKSGGFIPDGTYSYRFTFSHGKLGESSYDILSTLTVNAGTTDDGTWSHEGQVYPKLSIIPHAFRGSIALTFGGTWVDDSLEPEITHINVYRTKRNDPSAYYFVGRIRRGDYYFFDGLADESLGHALVENISHPPLCRMLASYAGRMFYIGDKANKNRVYYSEEHRPCTVDTFNYITDLESSTNDLIIATFELEGYLYFASSREIFRLTGTSPATYKIEKVCSEVGVDSPRSIKKWRDMVVFKGVDGVYIFDGNNARCISTTIEDVFRSGTNAGWPDKWATAFIRNNYYVLSFKSRLSRYNESSYNDSTFMISLDLWLKGQEAWTSWSAAFDSAATSVDGRVYIRQTHNYKPLCEVTDSFQQEMDTSEGVGALLPQFDLGETDCGYPHQEKIIDRIEIGVMSIAADCLAVMASDYNDEVAVGIRYNSPEWENYNLPKWNRDFAGASSWPIPSFKVLTIQPDINPIFEDMARGMSGRSFKLALQPTEPGPFKVLWVAWFFRLRTVGFPTEPAEVV